MVNPNAKTSGIYKDEEKAEAPPVWFFLKQPAILRNLLLLLVIWLGTVYNSYLITYLLNTFEQVFINYFFTSIVAFIACYVGGFLFDKIGIRLSLGGSLLMSTLAGFISWVYGIKHQDGWLFIFVW